MHNLSSLTSNNTIEVVDALTGAYDCIKRLQSLFVAIRLDEDIVEGVHIFNLSKIGEELTENYANSLLSLREQLDA